MRDLVDDFGFVGDTATNNDAAFAALQAAIDAGLAGEIFLPFNRSTNGVAQATGIYKTTLADPLIIKNDFTHLHFEQGAKIRHDPVAGGTTIKCERAGDSVLSCLFTNININCPSASGAKHTGLLLHDVRYSSVVNYRSQGFTSHIEDTALEVQGRDAMAFRDLYLVARRPVHLARNDAPYDGDLKSLDHVVFEGRIVLQIPDAYRGLGYDTPVIVCQAGFNARDMKWRGAQAWVGGGFYAIDDATIPARGSDNWLFDGLRVEGVQQPDEWETFAFKIEKYRGNRDGRLRNLYIKNALINNGGAWNGIRAYGVDGVVCDNVDFLTNNQRNGLETAGKVELLGGCRGMGSSRQPSKVPW